MQESAWHQEALDKWQLLLLTLNSEYSGQKSILCCLGTRVPSEQRHLGSIREAKEPRIWSLNHGHTTTSDHVTRSNVSKVWRAGPLVTPRAPRTVRTNVRAAWNEGLP